MASWRGTAGVPSTVRVAPRPVIEFLSLFYPLLDRPTQRRTWVSAGALLGLAALEAVALAALVPLMQLLTAPDLKPDSAAVDWISGVLGDPSPATLAIFLGTFVVVVYIVKSVAGIVVLRWTTTFALLQETRTVHRLMSGYLR